MDDWKRENIHLSPGQTNHTRSVWGAHWKRSVDRQECVQREQEMQGLESLGLKVMLAAGTGRA